MSQFIHVAQSVIDRLTRRHIDTYLQKRLSRERAANPLRANLITSCLNLSVFPSTYGSGAYFPPGLHLLIGGAGTGKTANSIALVHSLVFNYGMPATFCSVMEPRGIVFDPTGALKTAPAAGEKVEKQEEGLIKRYSYTMWLRKKLAAVRAAVSPDNQRLLQNPGQPPILVMDSVTYLLQQLTITQDYLSEHHVSTYKGGLSGADTIGALHHSAMAAAHGVALIATLNSDLVPIAKELKGACEGVAFSRGLGKLEYGNRGAGGRREFDLVLDADSIQFGLTTVGYGKFRTV